MVEIESYFFNFQSQPWITIASGAPDLNPNNVPRAYMKTPYNTT